MSALDSTQEEILLQRAKDALLARDYDRAERQLMFCLEENPTCAQAWLDLGNVYVSSNRDEKALETYQKLLKIDEKNFAAMDRLGGIYRRLGKYDESVKILNKASSIHGESVPISYNLGQTYKAMGKSDEAIKCFKSVLRINPQDVLAYNHLGCIYAGKNQHQDALEVFRRALSVDQNHPIIHFNSARSFEALGDYDSACSAYENALKKKPGWIDAMKGFAHLLCKMDKSEEAENLLDNAIKLNLNDAELHSMLGNLFALREKYEQAEAEFDMALKLNAQCLTALSGKIALLEKQNRQDEAYNLMLKMDSLVTGNTELSLQCAQFLMTLNKWSEAAERLQAVLEKNPNNPDALCLLAEYFLVKGEDIKAMHCYEKALKIKPENIHYRFDAARRLFDNGNYEAAETQMRYYLSAKPDDSNAWIFLALLYTELGDIESAVKVLRKVLSLEPESVALLAAAKRLNKNYPNNKNVSDLLKDVIEAQGGSVDNLENLEESLEMYEQTLEHLMENDDVDRNLRMLAEMPVEDDLYNFEELAEEESLTSNEEEEELMLGDGEEELSLMDDGFDELRESLDEVPLDFEQLEEDISPDDEFDSMVLGTGDDVPIDADPFEDDEDFARSSSGSKDNAGVFEPEEFMDLGTSQNAEKSEKQDEPAPQMPQMQMPPMPQYPPYQPQPYQYPPVTPPPVQEPVQQEPVQAPTPPKPAPVPPVQQTPPVPPRQEMPKTEPIKREEKLPLRDDSLAKKANALRKALKDEISAALKNLREQNRLAQTEQDVMLADMFRYMRGLCDFLPQPKKMLFMESENRVQLEYVIKKLDGDPGLLDEASVIAKTVEENEQRAPETFVKRKREELENNAENADELATTKPSVKDINNTIMYLQSLTHAIPDKDLATGLNTKIKKVLNRCVDEEVL